MIPWLAAISHVIYDAVGGWLFDHPLSPPKVLKARDEAAPPFAVD
jgi:CO/xanthine dehydrogenase Mo-binding subunit